MKLNHDQHPNAHPRVSETDGMVHIMGGMFGDAWCADDPDGAPDFDDAGTPQEHGMGDDPGEWPWCGPCLVSASEEGFVTE